MVYGSFALKRSWVVRTNAKLCPSIPCRGLEQAWPGFAERDGSVMRLGRVGGIGPRSPDYRRCSLVVSSFGAGVCASAY